MKKKKKARKPDTAQYDGHRQNADLYLKRAKGHVVQAMAEAREGNIQLAQAGVSKAFLNLGLAMDSLIWAMEWMPKP